MKGERLVVVSNRLPVVFEKKKREEWSVRPGTGGLVTALAPVLRDRGGVWIGWLGVAEEDGLDVTTSKRLLSDGGLKTGYSLHPVELTAEEVRRYYEGFSNEILWPLFHDLPSRCNFDPVGWETYRDVNRKFAEKIIESTREADYIWIHDYQLILAASQLKALGTRRNTSFFLHIPFPALDIFLKLPWRFQILEALLDYDLIGFQTPRDLCNVLRCVQMLKEKTRVLGKGIVRRIAMPEREVRAGAFPIGIDFREFSDLASGDEAVRLSRMIRSHFPDRKLVIGVDRLDYTKGIPEKLLGFANALERYPDLKGRISLIQVVVPSRTDVPEYQTLKVEIERLVGEINGRFSQVGWVPVHYLYRHLSRIQLVAYYRACRIALITPLKDGMNLVAKEYCAANRSRSSILILSEFAGAASQMYKDAVLINPYDRKGMADAIYKAFNMEDAQARARMRRLRSIVRRHDIFDWVNRFLDAGALKELDDFPLLDICAPMASGYDPRSKESGSAAWTRRHREG
jgi:trehalose 6-phosphate synthase/phosphatase